MSSQVSPSAGYVRRVAGLAGRHANHSSLSDEQATRKSSATMSALNEQLGIESRPWDQAATAWSRR